MSDYYQFRDETGAPIDYYQLVNDNNELCKEIERLQQKINRAIEYIKHSWWLKLDQVYDTSKDLKGWEVEQLLEILEGSENNR